MKYKESNPKNKILAIILLLMSVFSFLGCDDNRAEDRRILARINEYELKLNEFDRQLSSEMELDPEFQLTRKDKKAFLEQLIRKELMIQEAIRLKLDHKEKFVKTIERYWQSTLIRDLMQLKGEEINQTTYVSQEEIEARYLKMKEAGETDLVLNTIRDQIIADLKEEKKTEKLQAWITDLWGKATIEIDGELLKKAD